MMPLLLKRFAAAAALVLIGCTPRTQTVETQDGFRPLWNEQDFEGWHRLPGGSWTVEDGVIVGRNTQDDPRHGLLLTDDRYRDFTVRLKFKAVEGNSGLYFRVDEVDEAVGVHGFQAEIDAEKDVGGLYETGGRAWVVQPTPEQVRQYFRPGAWNDMVVEARGGDVVVYVNGVETAVLKDDPGRREGHIGLQLHGSQDLEVHFKDIEVQVAFPE